MSPLTALPLVFFDIELGLLLSPNHPDSAAQWISSTSEPLLSSIQYYNV